NLNAGFYLARAVVPGMKTRRRGSIIALGGQSSLTSRPNTVAVTVAKPGLLGLVRALAAELGPFGIRVNMVAPGYIDTERGYADWYPEVREGPADAPHPSRPAPPGPPASPGPPPTPRPFSSRFRCAGSPGPRRSPTPVCSWPP